MQINTTIPLGDRLAAAERVLAGRGTRADLRETHGHGRLSMVVAHMRPKDWKKNPRTGLLEPDYRWKDSQIGRVVDLDSAELVHEEERVNLILNVGRVFLHSQGYSNGSGVANGLNYIALTNTNVTPAAADTTLSGEIVANGLARAQGTVTLPTGSGNVTTIAHTFTCATAPQAAQAAALFALASAGTMNHELNFTQRSLQIGDTLAVTDSITLG